MTPLTIAVTVLAYFILLFTVSYLAGRKTDSKGFFGSRKSPWYIVAIATMGSFISGVTFVSVPGMVDEKGFSYLQMVMGFVVGQMIIAFVLVPLFYKMNLVSVYQYLEDRFGVKSYKTGAWFFFISKMLGASVRLFLVCLTLQLLVFEPAGLPFALNVALTVLVVWLFTFRGGVKSIIWTDVLKSLCLVLSVVLCIVFISSRLDLGFTDITGAIFSSDHSRIFFFDDINDGRFFFKQFLAAHGYVFKAVSLYFPASRIQMGLKFLQDRLPVGALHVHFIYEYKNRNAVFFQQLPESYGVSLHPFLAADYQYCVIQHCQSPLHFCAEVHVSRGVKQHDICTGLTCLCAGPARL